MNNKYRVVQVGLGPMGMNIAILLLKRKNIDLKGVVDIDPQLIGEKLTDILDMDVDNEIFIGSEVNRILNDNPVDLVIIATSSSLEKVFPIIKSVAGSGCHVISICEELSYPFQQHPDISEELDCLAKSKNVTVVGTGINPGYLMDLLPIVITAPCQSVSSIRVTRMMNSARRRQPFQKKIGTGLTVDEFHRKIRNKEITGHVGLTESIQMIAAALGMEYDEIVESPPQEVVADTKFTTSYGEVVPKNHVCGLRSRAFSLKEGNETVSLDFVAYAGDHEEYDSVFINGTPDIHLKIIGGVHGDLGTSAMVVNLIPKVIEARPGLLTMKDLPVPCNTENIFPQTFNTRSI